MEEPIEISRDNDDDSDEVLRWKLILGVTFLIMLAVGFSLTMALSDLSEEAGQYGDSFGWLTAIFSSMVSIGAVYAVYLQTKELNEARLESKKTNEDRAKVTDLRACIILIPDIKARRDRVDERIAELRRELDRLPQTRSVDKIYKFMNEKTTSTTSLWVRFGLPKNTESLLWNVLKSPEKKLMHIW